MSEDIFDEEMKDKGKRKSRELELLTMRQTMKTENGRSFMWRCLQNCRVSESIFNVDPVLHAYNAGAREHGLWLARELKEAAPDEYHMMLKEHDNE